MNRLSVAFALTVLTAAGAVAAQTMQSQTEPPAATQPPASAPSSQNPSSTAPDQDQAAPQAQESPNSGANSASGTTDKKTLMKECVKQERANNSGMSAKDAKKACKQQLSSSPPQN